jgi:predicted RNase H-like nuclease (RuvC/YqgF family)
MSAFSWILIVIGCLALAFIVVYLAVKRPEEGTWKWLLGAAGAIAAIVIGAITLGKVKPKVLRKRERKVAPTEREMAETDIESDHLDEEMENSKEAEKKLDQAAEETDEEKKELEERAGETDDKIVELEERRKEPSDEAPDDSGDEQPDPRIYDRLRDS